MGEVFEFVMVSDTLDLMELRQMARIGDVSAINATRRENVEWRTLLLHDADLHRAGVGTQENV